ncbi:MAG: cupin domain-containing protein [Limisphaerales bacterium]
MKKLTQILAGLIAATISVSAQTQATTPTAPPPAGHPIAGFIAQEDAWINAPPALAGAQMMILQGDITKPGPYTVRLRLPAGFKVPLHWNDNEVNMTVISGLLHIGIAPTYDATNSKEIGTLSFASLPPKMKHTEWVDTETIVQVHGLGPWIMHEVNPRATARVVE